MANKDGGTHYDGCWQFHFTCAIAEVEKQHAEKDAMASEILGLRKTLTEHEMLWRKSAVEQLDEIDQLRAEVAALRADAERYRWLRERMELRPMPTMKGTVRHGMTTRIGCAYPDAPLPRSTNPEYHEEQSKKLDAAIDDARKA